jgi:hypothetical protein
MTRIKVRIEGHYEVQALPFGRDYVWVPGGASIECDCGQVIDVDAQHTRCPTCGADRMDVLRELVGSRLGAETPRPWRGEYEDWRAHRGDRTESEEWRELRSLDEN